MTRGDSPLRICEMSATFPPMTAIQNVCVYCGSGPGTDPRFVAAAHEFGSILAENGIVGLSVFAGWLFLQWTYARQIKHLTADHTVDTCKI